MRIIKKICSLAVYGFKEFWVTCTFKEVSIKTIDAQNYIVWKYRKKMRSNLLYYTNNEIRSMCFCL